MHTGTKVSVTLLLLVAIVGLVAVDAYWNGRELRALLPQWNTVADDGEGDATSSIPAEEGVAKMSGVPIEEVLAEMDLTFQPSQDASILEQVIAGRATVQSYNIIAGNDRAGSITWVESPQVKLFFIGLKEALLSVFSANVQDLRDITEQDPVRNILSFYDPGIDPDHSLEYVRRGEVLFEIRRVRNPENEDIMIRLRDALTAE